MFQTIKNEVSILEVAEEMFDRPFQAIGDKTFGPEDKACPFCSHNDCFRVKDDGPDSVFKCFSCDVSGSVIDMVAQYKKITEVEAGKQLVKRFKLRIPSSSSPVQEVFTLAATYYLNCLKDAKPCAELNGLTPMEYQEQIRKHTPESIDKFMVGWSDGKLISYLEALGIDPEILKECGLVSTKGGDFLPAKAFIYPHFVRGRASHFTFKDPLKQKQWQLKNKSKLNGVSFYNSDSISNKEAPVIVVEGENDCISISETTWTGGVICCNGSISAEQLEWMSTNLANRDVITIFDADPAGDKYREKVGKLRGHFSSLYQVKLTNGLKDIDEYLKNGGELEAAIKNNLESPDDAGIEVEGVDAKSIVEKNGAYYRVKRKEGNEFFIQMTNFLVKLNNIYIRGGEREREIIIIRQDGRKSDPIKVNSDAKVSLKPFKNLIANAVDASFYGKEEDLTAMWEHVYSTCEERVVYLPETVGRIEEFNGWLFRDVFISESGSTHLPGEDGVIWINGSTTGLKAVSLIANGTKEESLGIPAMMTGLNEQEREELLQGFIENLSENLGNLGDALTAVAWAWSTVYCNLLNKDIYPKFFPFLYFYGRFGKGKSTLLKWIMTLFNMEDSGYSTLPQFNSGVSFTRKLAYYSTVPMCMDEIRADRTTTEKYGTFRAWYDRAGRATGMREGAGVKEWPVRATLMFAGEAQFNDDATRARCIPIKVPRQGRETKKTYDWINGKSNQLRAIGYHWIVNYSKISKETLVKEFGEVSSILQKEGLSDRSARNWSLTAIFALRLVEKYFPTFNYMEYLKIASARDSELQLEDSVVTQFWEVIEGVNSMDNSPITGTHIRTEKGKVYVWFTEVYRLFETVVPYSDRDKFSKRAILEILKEEPYFVSDQDRAKMGMEGKVRRVLTFDLTKCPESLQNIVSF